MSSRNGYLSDAEKETAKVLYQTLTSAAETLSSGSKDFAAIKQQAVETLTSAGLKPDYFNICQRYLKACYTERHTIGYSRCGLLGKVRLIDNIQVPCRERKRYEARVHIAVTHRFSWLY